MGQISTRAQWPWKMSLGESSVSQPSVNTCGNTHLFYLACSNDRYLFVHVHIARCDAISLATSSEPVRCHS